MRYKKTGRVIEIFSSIQGEGLYVGQRQIFIRFDKCNLKCIYCDLSSKIKARAITSEEIIDKVKQLSRFGIKNKVSGLGTDSRGFLSKGAQVISLTGGEPLCQTGFLRELLPQLKECGYNLYLETNATLPKQLVQVISWIDVISMDLKLPSAAACRPFWKEHALFLKTAVSTKRKLEVFVKVVVTPDTKERDVKKAVDLVREINSQTPFVIQPVWPAGRVRSKVPWKRLLEFESLAGQYLINTRVIPQVHKILGCR